MYPGASPTSARVSFPGDDRGFRPAWRTKYQFRRFPRETTGGASETFREDQSATRTVKGNGPVESGPGAKNSTRSRRPQSRIRRLAALRTAVDLGRQEASRPPGAAQSRPVSK